jgi:hypothetical protein
MKWTPNGWVAILALSSMVLGASAAQAHASDGRYVGVTVTDGGVDLVVSAEAERVAVAVGLGLDFDDHALAARREVVAARLSRGLEVAAESGACVASPGSVRRVAGESGSMVAHTIGFACPEGAQEIVLIDHQLDVSASSAHTIVTLDGAPQVLRPGAASVVMKRPGAWSTAVAFVVEGGVHLVTGYDHLLFVLTLLLAAGTSVRTRGVRHAVLAAARVITAFTLGHSLTLALAALDVVALPSALVEAAIAASIVAAAALNLWRPEAGAERPWLAALFGLVHGFGFSSVLAEAGLPSNQRVLALLSFNVGIELAQLAVVALTIPLLGYLARKSSYQRRVLVPGSLAILAVAALWLVERASLT